MDEEAIQQPEVETGPADLAEAFRMVGKAEQGTAQNPVEPGSNEDAGQEHPVSSEEPGGDNQDYQVSGGYSDDLTGIDIQPARDAILTSVQRAAYEDVAETFKKEGIKTVSIDMLYERDERTGQVSFKNPDNPNKNFESRAEAQQWCDAFNNQIKAKFNSEFRAKQNEYYKQAIPRLQVLAFKDEYASMDKTTQAVFDDLIEPFEIQDDRGRTIGYNCDLGMMADRARKISGRFKQTETPQQTTSTSQPKQASKPAMDMKTGSSGANSDFKEPKDIGEALKMFDKMNRKKA